MNRAVIAMQFVVQHTSKYIILGESRSKTGPLWAAGFAVHVAAPVLGILLWIIDGSGLSCQCAGSGNAGAFLHPNK